MLQNFLIVGEQVLVLCCIMALGFLCNRVHWLDEKAVKSITNIVLYFVTPCVIINSFSREVDSALVSGLIITAVVAFLTFFISIAFAHSCIKDKDKELERVYRYAAVFGNCGFMALPLEQAVLGDIGAFFGAVYIAVFNLFVWTYGVWLMSGDKKYISAKSLVLNPGLIGTFVGIIILVTGLKLPSVLSTSIGYMAALNTPLPMIVIGYYLGNLSVNRIVSNKKQYLISFYKLLLFPSVALLMMYFAKVDTTVMVVCTIAAAAPTAANTAMFATLYGKDAELGAQIMSVSTLLSLFTLPLLVAFAQSI
ncbi:MAG: AEC family transporter [Oscillospiraceae bacterium]|nr:AEC family transporter [Candidatus Limimonas coprohippi]